MKLRAMSAAAAMAAVAGCVSVEEPAPPLVPVAPAPSPPVVPPVVEEPPAPAPRPVTIAPPAPEVVRPSEADALLHDFVRLRRLAGGEITREQDAARFAFNQTRSDSARVRLAMTLALPTIAPDDTRALELLEPLVKAPASALHPLAVLLTSYIQEQRKLGAQIAGLQQNVQGLQQNVLGLQQKLDAIMKLERSLTGRGEVGTVRRR